jgi:4-amino-4-deoxychorismate lyase
VPRLLETIKCLDGKVYHLDYHQKRFDLSRKRLGYNNPLKLFLTPPLKGLFRCRLIYEKEIEKIEFVPYNPKEFKRFKLIHSDITYDLKYEDRDEINALMAKKEDADEIIIVKDSLLTDTSIANLCLFDGKDWLTPRSPLLNGTTRQRLLDEKKIKEADISYEDIQKFSKIAIINAMIDFHIIENAIIS